MAENSLCITVIPVMNSDLAHALSKMVTAMRS